MTLCYILSKICMLQFVAASDSMGVCWSIKRNTEIQRIPQCKIGCKLQFVWTDVLNLHACLVSVKENGTRNITFCQSEMDSTPIYQQELLKQVKKNAFRKSCARQEDIIHCNNVSRKSVEKTQHCLYGFLARKEVNRKICT